jgi:hypothetical protein
MCKAPGSTPSTAKNKIPRIKAGEIMKSFTETLDYGI